MKKVLSNFLYRCWLILAALIILLAVMISIARVLTPYINDYRPQIEDWLSQQLGQEVTIGEIKSEWKTLGPSLTLYEINVENVIYIGAVKADIKTIPSLFYASVITDNLAISGINLLLNQTSSGGFALSTTTNSEQSSASLAISDVQDWLQSQTAVRLLEANIEITLRNGESYPIEIAEMQFSSGRNMSQLTGFSQLPGDNRIDFILEMDGYLTDPETRGQLFVDTHTLDLTQIPLAAFWEEAKVQDGTLAVQLWLDWENTAFRNGLAVIDINEFELSLADTPQGQVKRVSSQIMWQALEDGWQFQTNDAAVNSQGRQWPEPFVQLRQVNDPETDTQGYYLRSSLVDLGILTDLLLANQDLDDELRRRLLTMDTHGFLDALQIDAQTSAGELTDINLSARFSEIRFEAYETTPGVKNLSGQVQLDENSGNLYIDSRYARLDYPDMFRWPLDMEYINADLDWRIEEDNLSIILQQLDTSIRGANLKADGIFNISNDRVDMNLYAELDDGDMSQTRYFLPSGIMNPNLVNYLDESVKSGDLNNVKVLLSGEASDFPFTNGKGVFAIHGEVSNSEFAFQPEWPSLNDMSADLWFVGNGMDIQLSGANSYAQNIQSARAVISDFSAAPAILEIGAVSRGRLDQAPEYLANTPLRDNFEELFSTLFGAGEFEFNLDLLIPLDEGDTQVNGKIILDNNPINIPAANLQAKIVDGNIDIVNGFAVSEGLRVEVLGGESVVTLNQSDTDLGITTELTMSGEIDADGLYEAFAEQLPSGLSGKTQYQGTISIPASSETDFALSVATRMQGIMADLPYPLYKSADVGWPMEFNYTIDTENNHELEFNWLEKLHLKLGKPDEAEQFSGMLMLGRGTAELTGRNGVEITGVADKVDLVSWLDYFENSANDESEDTVDFSGFYLNDLTISELDYFFLKFTDNNISATFSPEQLAFLVEGADISGNITVPLPIASQPIDLTLSKLSIPNLVATDTENTEEQPIDYSQADAEPLPPINLSCDVCIYNEARLGKTEVKLRPLAFGNQLDIKIAENNYLSLDVKGQWQYANDRVTTQVAGDAATGSLARLLRLLNQDAGIRETAMTMTGDINWLGDPSMFSMRTLNGSVAIDGKKGSQKQLSDRPARIFSVLSLGSIARRLTLDFSDLFQDGFFYTGMSGSFEITQGVFDTKDFDIRGTSADVSINGKADFANNKIEQCILVTPDLSGSLPVLAGWAIEPVTGFVVFLMSKIFKPAIDVVSSIRYQVEGTFDDPIVKEIGKSRAKATIEEEDSENPNIILEASEKPFSCDETFVRNKRN